MSDRGGLSDSDESVTPSVLVVDDEVWVREAIAGFLTLKGFQCEMSASVEEALDQLGKGSFDLLISDINMPGQSGLQLFARVTKLHPDIAVVMVTGVLDVNTAVEIMRGGAYDYITKPVEFEQLLERVNAALRKRRTRLEEDKIARRLQQSLSSTTGALDDALQDLEQQRVTTLETLVRALDAREKETRMHSFRVQAYAVRLGDEFDFDEAERIDLARGALLHDIGKIGVPDTILLKPGKLTEAEWAEIRKHPQIGYDILQGMDFLQRAAQMVLHHHESFDGSGYPDGLAGAAIPLESRIFAVVDCYDALTSDRPYRDSLSSEEGFRRIRELAGVQFDPVVVAKFLAIAHSEWDAIRRRYS